MSQNQKRKTPKRKIEAHPHSVIIVNQPMVRNFSTGGGHLAGDTLVEGDDKIATKKWQGYPPENLNLVGKPRPPLAEVAMPRYTGKAEYATRVWFPNMLFAKLLTSPHPRARVRKMDTAKAMQKPGIAYILTRENSPKTYPLPEELFFQGDVVAIVAAETEDLAEDALEAIEVDYEVLPFASSLAQIMSRDAPDLSQAGRGQPNTDATGVGAGPGQGAQGGQGQQGGQERQRRGNLTTSLAQYGDIEKGFQEADIVKEFTYYYAGGVVAPLQPCGSVAKWDGDKVTVWGHGQAIYPARALIARGLGMDPSNVRFVNKWNGGTFGGVRQASEKFYPWVAYIAKMAGRPVKLTLTKDQELAHMQVKPENIQKFKVGAKKDGRITACQREFHVNSGERGSGGSGGRSELYLHVIPNWKEIGNDYRTNSMTAGPSRSNMQQEFKWGWEQMMDEMAEAVGMDPVQFRMLNVQKPGTKVSVEQGGPTVIPMPESEKGFLTYDSYASVEVLQEGMKAIGWGKRNPVAGGNPGRFKRGFGVAMSQHHAGRLGYHEGEVGFERVVKRGNADVYQSEIELNADANVILHFAQPDSGTNHGTGISTQVAEILGFTTLDHIRLVWGDSALAPPAPGWNSGLTTQLQGGALCKAADKLRQDLLKRASDFLKVDAANLQIRDGIISSKEDPKKATTFAALARASDGRVLRQHASCVHPGSIGRAMNRGIGACFVEVEVDTFTGNWRFIKAAYCHDTGNVINPLLAEADMNGSLVQSTQVATEAIPWDREFPGTRHYSVGYLSYRLPTIMDVPEQTQVFVNSLEPRWFFGTKGFAETAIGAPPGAIANAIYNACGVRIREHPITKEKILAGLNAKRAGKA
jgi:CO/xanthine dehydrogenase Mo-binding subunit